MPGNWHSVSSIGCCQGAVGAPQPESHARKDMPGGGEGLRPGWVMPLGRQQADQPHVARPVGMRDDGPETVARAPAQHGRGGGADMHELAQGGKIAPRHVGVVHQFEKLRLHQE
jgi:hypothetical protein